MGARPRSFSRPPRVEGRGSASGGPVFAFSLASLASSTRGWDFRCRGEGVARIIRQHPAAEFARLVGCRRPSGVPGGRRGGGSERTGEARRIRVGRRAGNAVSESGGLAGWVSGPGPPRPRASPRRHSRAQGATPEEPLPRLAQHRLHPRGVVQDGRDGTRGRGLDGRRAASRAGRRAAGTEARPARRSPLDTPQPREPDRQRGEERLAGRSRRARRPGEGTVPARAAASRGERP